MGEVSPWAFNGVADGPEQRTLSSLPCPLGGRGFHSGIAVQSLQSLTAAKLSQGRGAGMGPGARPSVLGLTSGGRAEADLGYGSTRWRLLLFRVGTSGAGCVVLLRGSHRSGARSLRWGRGCRGCSSSPLLLSRATTGCLSPPNHFGECSPQPRYSPAAGRHGYQPARVGDSSPRLEGAAASSSPPSRTSPTWAPPFSPESKERIVFLSLAKSACPIYPAWTSLFKGQGSHLQQPFTCSTSSVWKGAAMPLPSTPSA